MTDKWIKDTGLVFALLFLFLGYRGDRAFLTVSMVLLVISILVPKALYPLAYLWQKLVNLLNIILPRIFFGFVFFVIVFPIGAIRRLIEGEWIVIRGWRHAASLFVDRDHLYVKTDLEMPY